MPGRASRASSTAWRRKAGVSLPSPGLFPYAPLNYFFGVSRVPFLHFLLATIFFMAPSALAYSWLGHIGMEAAAGRGNWVKFALLGLAALALIIFLPRVIKYIRK